MTKGLRGKQEGSSRFPEQVKLTSERKTELCSTETILQNTPDFSSLEKYFTILLGRLSTSRSILQIFSNLIDQLRFHELFSYSKVRKESIP